MRLVASDVTDLTAEQVLGSNYAMAVSIADWREYGADKQPTKLLGSRLTVLAPAKRYKEVTVKIPSTLPFSQKDLDEADGIYIRFKDFSGKCYRANDGTCPVTATASGIEIIGGRNQNAEI